MRKLLHSEISGLRLNPDDPALSERHPVTLILHNIRSLYNVGSIFRTADSALLKEVVLCGFTPHPPRKEIDKTALGATQTVPWRYFHKIEDAINTLKSESNKILALEITDEQRNYQSITTGEFPLCLVLGNELTGIDDDVLALCDGSIEIPMYGTKHSLNVAVAAGIAAYELVSVWRGSYKD
ncbi:MAG: SpoU rRNA methylase [Ignavibacteria bacterium]|nr:SpoU rRNA methylase [Ignavibacteria bacterium]